jgi:hypothetical protein
MPRPPSVLTAWMTLHSTCILRSRESPPGGAPTVLSEMRFKYRLAGALRYSLIILALTFSILLTFVHDKRLAWAISAVAAAAGAAASVTSTRAEMTAKKRKKEEKESMSRARPHMTTYALLGSVA